MYFKTPGGNWVAASEDESGRLFMIDQVGTASCISPSYDGAHVIGPMRFEQQVGDLYYDSGDPEIGLYAVRLGIWISAG